MNNKTIFLDHFALVRVTSDQLFAAIVKEFVISNEYTLIIGVMNLIELYRWKKRWSEVIDLIASMPFCIAQNPEEITDSEIRNYPKEISLPTGFCSSDYTYSYTDLKGAIEINLRGKIASFDRRYRDEQQNILEDILNNRNSFPPEEDGRYSSYQRWLFLQTNVLKLLFPTHGDYLKRQLGKSQEIRIECFKSIFIQVLAIFLEYYVQKKDGKPSDIGDLYQLSYIPYISLAVVDNERNDLIQRMNRTGLFSKRLPACNLAQFRDIVEGRTQSLIVVP